MSFNIVITIGFTCVCMCIKSDRSVFVEVKVKHLFLDFLDRALWKGHFNGMKIKMHTMNLAWKIGLTQRTVCITPGEKMVRRVEYQKCFDFKINIHPAIYPLSSPFFPCCLFTFKCHFEHCMQRVCQPVCNTVCSSIERICRKVCSRCVCIERARTKDERTKNCIDKETNITHIHKRARKKKSRTNERE